MRRRDVLAGGIALGATVMTPIGAAQAAGAARREFRILRDGSDIGRHVVAAEMTAAGFEVAINIDLRIKVLGITAYRYSLANREVWAKGRIVSVEGETDDDGDRNHARIRAAGDVLEIDGSAYSGTAPADAVTTSYFARPFIQRRPWISTQSGMPLDIDVAALPHDRLEGWAVRGDMETELFYDARGEWIGCAFDAGGSVASYEVIEDTGAIAALWAQA